MISAEMIHFSPSQHESPSKGILCSKQLYSHILMRASWLCLTVFWLGQCGSQEPLSCLDKLQRNGELVVLTRNAPTTYYLGRDGYKGFEYELASAFASHLGLKPRFVTLDNTNEILSQIEHGEGHFGAAGLTRTPEREARLLFGPNYLEVQQQVVSRRRRFKPDSLEELVGLRVGIIAGSSYEERLLIMQEQIPRLNWTATLEKETEGLLEDVWARRLDCTIADSNIVAINRRYFPELQISFTVGEPEHLAWVVNPECGELAAAMETWFASEAAKQELDRLKERYFAFVPIFDYVDIRSFKRRIKRRLPKYESLFKQAAAEYGFDWTLLAAQAYQESHWLVHATSPTGVRGIMMLTKNTAAQLGIEDRLDPESSIFGGAEYLRQVYERLPASIQGGDRIFFALAAYNVGYGHVMDARNLALGMGKDPNQWTEIREVLPLLSQKRYYRKLRFGYARGMEPVRYVQRIRDFQDILERELQIVNL